MSKTKVDLNKPHAVIDGKLINVYNPYFEKKVLSIKQYKLEAELNAPHLLVAPSPTRENAFDSVIAERAKQFALGYTRENDLEGASEALAMAGGLYALSPRLSLIGGLEGRNLIFNCLWPFNPESYKPTTRRQDLVKAAALIIAEIDRMDALDFDYLTHPKDENEKPAV